MQSCICFVDILAGGKKKKKFVIRMDLEMHLLNEVREEQIVLPLKKKPAAQSKTESPTYRGARG